jgi:hypothetical protein
VKVHDLDRSQLGEVYELVKQFDNPLPRQQWIDKLSVPWNVEGRPLGIITVDEGGDGTAGRVVGFLGYFFANRSIDGVEQQVCNQHTLILADDSRGAGAKLLVRGLRVKGAITTALTPVPNVHHMLSRAGYKTLDDRVTMLLPSVAGRASRRSLRWSDVSIHHGADEVLERLDDSTARLVIDHRDTGCRFLLVERAGRRCLIVHRKMGTRAGYGFVLHAGDHDMLDELTVPIRHSIMESCEVRSVGVDARFLRGRRPRFSVDVPLDTRRLYRHSESPPWMFDNLYSELAVLGSPALPSIREDVRQLVLPKIRRYLPGRRPSSE